MRKDYERDRLSGIVRRFKAPAPAPSVSDRTRVKPNASHLIGLVNQTVLFHYPDRQTCQSLKEDQRTLPLCSVYQFGHLVL